MSLIIRLIKTNDNEYKGIKINLKVKYKQLL